MSLYTPVFPPFHEFNSSQRVSLDSNSVAPLAKQQNHVRYLRDLHLFLSTQSDMLSPPSRPGSPLFDHRVQKVKDKIHGIFNATEGDTSCGKWTRASQTLKLGCIRGRYWSIPQADPCAPEQNVNWILPDEESDWIEWEKKREESRRLKAKTNASPQIGNSAPAAPDSHNPGYASFAGPSQPDDMARRRPPPGVTPSTFRAAKEKVRRWQASIPSEVWHDTTRGSSPASTREAAAAPDGKGEIARPQRTRTLDFAVVKPTAKLFVGKRTKGSLSHPAIRSDSGLTPSGQSKSPRPIQTSDVPQDSTPVDVDKTAYKGPAKTPPVKDDTPKITDVPEMLYLPPSFPAQLETSTPLNNSKILVRTKPSPILPTFLSTPPPSTPANPPDDHQLVSAESLDANATSSLLPQIDSVQPEKRSRVSFMSVDGVPNDPPVTPPIKRPRTQSQNSSPPIPENHPEPMSPNGALSAVPCAQDGARGPSPGAVSSHRYPMNSIETALGVPLTPGKTDEPIMSADVQDLAEKIPSPTKSVKSYFSAPDSDLADSPVKTNLLLESPVSPMLSYARNPSIFLPQVTSTQVRKGCPTGRTNSGILANGMGYSSQFDVERHVDRVSELLEKDVDFDGWLRDARTVEMSQD